MIIIQTPESRIFDSAYFVIRAKADTEKAADESEMVKEANRIIAEASGTSQKAMSERFRHLRSLIPPFAVGTAIGGIIIGLLWFISCIA